MNWKEALEEERAALKRIVALLLALAGLAESAASRSAPVRGFVLWLLRRALAAALDFVGQPDSALPSISIGRAGYGPADALRLAVRFRDLATQLDRESSLLPTSPDGGEGEPWPLDRMRAIKRFLAALSAPTALACRTVCPAPAPDTS